VETMKAYRLPSGSPNRLRFLLPECTPALLKSLSGSVGAIRHGKSFVFANFDRQRDLPSGGYVLTIDLEPLNPSVEVLGGSNPAKAPRSQPMEWLDELEKLPEHPEPVPEHLVERAGAVTVREDD
jgi:hypothetical protein